MKPIAIAIIFGILCLRKGHGVIDSATVLIEAGIALWLVIKFTK